MSISILFGYRLNKIDINPFFLSIVVLPVKFCISNSLSNSLMPSIENKTFKYSSLSKYLLLINKNIKNL